MHYLTATAIFRGENHWIEEWLQYHLALGIGHFYLYDNEDDRTESSRILRPYVERGLVDVVPWPGRFQQLSAYQDALKYRSDETLWMTFLDLDEFIVPNHVVSIPEFLEEFESEKGLAIHWNIFGSSGYIETPTDQINHFLHRAVTGHPANRHVKSIVKPKFVLPKPMYNPHLFNLSEGRTVDETGQVVTDAICDYVGDRIRIAHYAVRSRRFFEETKSKRGSPISVHNAKSMKYWKYMDRNDVFDDEISRRFGHMIRENR